MTKRKRTSAKTKPSRSDAPAAAPVHGRRIILLDERPLRAQAAQEFHETMGKLEKARTQWRRYEQEDQPAYGRWMARTFGALMTEIRENDRQMHEWRTLIDEVDDELIFHWNMSPQEAYQRVMRRRTDPEAFADEEKEKDPWGEEETARGKRSAKTGGDDEDEESPFGSSADDVPEKERRKMFEDFLQSFFGVRIDEIPREAYENLYASFEADTFGGPPQPRRAKRSNREPTPPKSEEGSTQSRIKEISRILVRRLHPDRRAHSHTEDTTLWHEVQEAYAAQNLDRLETLWALTELQGGSNGKNASLFQLHSALKELKRGFKALQKGLKEAKNDPAWGFSQVTNTQYPETIVRRELTHSLGMQKHALTDLRRIIDDLSRPPKPAKPRHTNKTKKQAKKNVKPGSKGGQNETNPPPPSAPSPKTRQARDVQPDLFSF